MFSNQQLNTFSTAPKTATNLRTPHTTIKALKLLANKHAVKKNKIEKKECISQFWGPSTVCRWPRPTSTPLASGSIQQFGYDSPVSPTNQPTSEPSVMSTAIWAVCTFKVQLCSVQNIWNCMGLKEMNMHLTARARATAIYCHLPIFITITESQYITSS